MHCKCIKQQNFRIAKSEDFKVVLQHKQQIVSKTPKTSYKS